MDDRREPDRRIDQILNQNAEIFDQLRENRDIGIETRTHIYTVRDDVKSLKRTVEAHSERITANETKIAGVLKKSSLAGTAAGGAVGGVLLVLDWLWGKLNMKLGGG